MHLELRRYVVDARYWHVFVRIYLEADDKIVLDDTQDSSFNNYWPTLQPLFANFTQYPHLKMPTYDYTCDHQCQNEGHARRLEVKFRDEFNQIECIFRGWKQQYLNRRRIEEAIRARLKRLDDEAAHKKEDAARKAARREVISVIESPDIDVAGILDAIQQDHNALQTNQNRVPRVDTTVATIERDGTAVRLYLALSQEDRAVVEEFGLNERFYEDDPLYSREQVETKRLEFEAEAEAAADIHRKTELRLAHIEMLKEMANRRVRRYISDFLAWPHVRVFETRYQVTEYCDKLEKVLRTMHADIDTYKNKIRNRTVEVKRPTPTPIRDNYEELRPPPPPEPS